MALNPMQKDFFNERAEVWDEIAVHDPDMVEHVADLLHLTGDESILDVGTGTGVMIDPYMKRIPDGKVTAIDYSENMITVARRKHPRDKYRNVEFVVSDLYDYSPGIVFDVVVCYSCFPHFNEKQRSIDHLASMLRTGGTFMISHGKSRDKINQVHREGGVVISKDYLPDMPSMEGMFESAGLKVTYTQDDDRCFIIVGVKQ